MATITSNTYLDGGVARTAGEAWTINGGVLTIRTDTRWHANAPASMTGSIAATTISSTLGGGVLIDARNVRWMPFNSGAGVVPAIGTTVSQGGVSGYFLGVWADLTSAPTAVGAAMPTTGFIKFREVTGGNFAAGALTGISASATSVDVAGWIEVVQRQAVANTVPRLGSFKTRGDWFYLDDTTGVAGQILQVPTNGGGAGTHVPAVWIETGVGTGEYEIYPAVLGTWFLAANLSTDIRSKFVQTLGNGQVRIGNDGTADAGYLPPAGCKVRIPNILGRQSTAAGGDAVNRPPHTTLATRPDFTTTSAGEIDFEYFLNDWYHLFASAYKVRIVNSATFDTHTSSAEASPTELENYATGCYIAALNLSLTNNQLGGTITDCKFVRPDASSSGHPVVFTGCSNYTISNLTAGVITYSRSVGAVYFTQCRQINIDNFVLFCATLIFNTSSNIIVNNYNYIDRILGVSNSTGGKYAVQCLAACDSIFMDGIILSYVADLGPYSGVFNASSCSNLTFRNLGTFAAPVDVNAAAAPAYIFQDGGNNDGVRVQRCYLEATRTSNYVTVNTSKNISIENCGGTTGSIQTLSANTQVKGIRSASNSVTGGTAVYGSHWFDMFDSDTQGRIWLAFNEPTAFSADQYEAVSLGTGAGFTSAGGLVLPNLGDEVIWTMPYYAIGHTAFDNSAPVLTGTNTGNFTITYDLDAGAGFSGTFKTLNAANLSGETIDPATGFKLKIKVVTATANASNLLSYIRVTTDSTAIAQENNLYPLDFSTIELTGLVAGSRVQLYDLTNDDEIYNGVVSGTTLSYSAAYSDDFNCRVRIMRMSGTTAYEFVEFEQVVGIDGFSRAVAQSIDAVYAANGIDGSAVSGIEINDGALLVEIDTGTLSWAAIYAYETYWLFTEEGIRDESRFIRAIDTANYVFTDFKIKNVSSPTAPLTITGGWGRDSVTGETVTLIDTSGGTIFSNPDLVVAYETAGGGAGGPTAAEIWAYSTRSLTQTIPSAAQNAAAVRVELAAELGNIDAAISSRLSSAGYTAPDNLSIAAILQDTGTAGVLLSASALDSVAGIIAAVLASYDAPTKAELDAAVSPLAQENTVLLVSAKTDNLPAAPADQSLITAGFENIADPWAAAIEAGLTAGEILRIIAAVLAGKVSGAGSGTETFSGLDGTTPRVVSTVDDGGNRTAVAVDGS